jgi:hypothetical protein
MEKCPECDKPWPCSTCGDSSDLSHLPPLQAQIRSLKRALWFLHLGRRHLAADGKMVAVETVEDAIRSVDDVVTALKELVIH